MTADEKSDPPRAKPLEGMASSELREMIRKLESGESSDPVEPKKKGGAPPAPAPTYIPATVSFPRTSPPRRDSGREKS